MESYNSCDLYDSCDLYNSYDFYVSYYSSARASEETLRVSLLIFSSVKLQHQYLIQISFSSQIDYIKLYRKVNRILSYNLTFYRIL